MDNILEVENVTKAYTGHVALDDVSLSVPRGTIYGLLGPNGAGKTTLIRIINHITAPDSGRVIFDGHQLSEADVAHIGYLPEERGLYKKMKVGEQAVFFARLKGLSHSEATRALKEWFDRFEIGSWWNRKVEELSKGMAQKVQFIVTVLHRPKLLIFDEPFSGFDPINANLLRDEILKLRDEGSTVIFSTHNMASVEEVCDHITLIDKSHDILSGRVADIRRSHGDNLFDVTWRGDAAALENAVRGRCELLDRTDDGSAYRTARIRIDRNDGVRGVLAALNEAVEIRSFSEVIPSMNDIFIRAVNGSL